MQTNKMAVDQYKRDKHRDKCSFGWQKGLNNILRPGMTRAEALSGR